MDSEYLLGESLQVRQSRGELLPGSFVTVQCFIQLVTKFLLDLGVPYELNKRPLCEPR